MFDQIKGKGRFTKTELRGYDAPIFLDFPRLKSGADTSQSLANYLGMKTVDIGKKRDQQYKWYSFNLTSTIFRDGSLEIEEIDLSAELPKERIIEFFKVHKFDSSSVPAIFEKWNIGDQYFYFRKKDDRLARQEKRQQTIEERQEFQKRLTLERIGGVYIPKNLGDCFLELDKTLSAIDRKEMLALPKRDDMIQYHHGLGMWMRNDWGLWSGSRLQKYFTDRRMRHPDNMSSVILYYYHDWLHGNKETWKEWEKDPK